MGIAKSGQPAARGLRKALDVAAKHFDEHQLAELGQDRLAAGPLAAALRQSMAKQVRDPATRRRLAHAHQGRQRGQQWVERTGVASDEAAYVTGAFLSPASVAYQGEGRTLADIDD